MATVAPSSARVLAIWWGLWSAGCIGLYNNARVAEAQWLGVVQR